MIDLADSYPSLPTHHVCMFNFLIFSMNCLAHRCLFWQSRVPRCGFFHHVCFHLETQFFEPCSSWLVLHLTLTFEFYLGLFWLSMCSLGFSVFWLQPCLVHTMEFTLEIIVPSLCHAATTAAFESREGEQAPHWSSLKLPKAWTKTCGRAGTGIPSSHPHLTCNNTGCQQGSPIWVTDEIVQFCNAQRWAQLFRVHTREVLYC